MSRRASGSGDRRVTGGFARAAYLYALLLMFSGAAHAAAVRILLEVQGAASVEPVPIKVRAVPAVAPASPRPLQAAPGTARSVDAMAPGEAILDLDPGVAWRISAESVGLWAEPVAFVPTGAGDVRVLRLYPAGSLRGSFGLPAGEKLPGEVTMRFQPAGVHAPHRDLPSGTVRCQVIGTEETGTAWDCELPAGELDLRIRVRGFLTHYRWAVKLQAGGQLDLGMLELRRGAAVVGWVQTADGQPIDPSCRVELAPRGAAESSSPTETRRQRLLPLTGSVNDRGFFHLDGVPPGEYVLTASQKGYAKARVHPVTVLENAETEVRLVQLERPLPLEVYVAPPVDPYGEGWLVTLEETGLIPGSVELVTEGTRTTPEGYWRREGLNPGSYRIFLFDRFGASFAARDVELEVASGPLFIDLPLVSVEGEVTLGDRPLVATLFFGGRRGAPSIPLVSDAEGRFQGYLPREGEWPVDVVARSPRVLRRLAAVAVEPAPGTTHARVEIPLPETALTGRVLDENGDTVPSALVTAVGADFSEAFSWARSGEDGGFSFEGMKPGRYVLTATAEGAASDAQVTELTQGEDAEEVVMVLHPMVPLRGRVVAGSGGVVAARILVTGEADGRPLPASGPPVQTDVEGRFEAFLPAGTQAAVLRVLAAGFSLRALRIEPLPSEPVEVAVDQSGGTLLLRVGERTAVGPPAFVIRRDGILLDGRLLELWAQINGVPSQDPEVLLVPRVEAGSYDLCRLEIAVEPQSQRLFPRLTTCTGGFLPPLGELTLKLDGGLQGAGR